MLWVTGMTSVAAHHLTPGWDINSTTESLRFSGGGAVPCLCHIRQSGEHSARHRAGQGWAQCFRPQCFISTLSLVSLAWSFSYRSNTRKDTKWKGRKGGGKKGRQEKKSKDRNILEKDGQGPGVSDRTACTPRSAGVLSRAGHAAAPTGHAKGPTGRVAAKPGQGSTAACRLRVCPVQGAEATSLCYLFSGSPCTETQADSGESVKALAGTTGLRVSARLGSVTCKVTLHQEDTTAQSAQDAHRGVAGSARLLEGAGRGEGDWAHVQGKRPGVLPVHRVTPYHSVSSLSQPSSCLSVCVVPQLTPQSRLLSPWGCGHPVP